uniref:Reverse transcriptase RNase H-like domain-containing protein n=1 Tax=Photinus pyralis TaxID=7054 RepID=A0A1Y1MYY1_PHOPY
MLIGKEFTIETDHRALTHLMSTRFANNRIYRWSLILQEFSFKIEYIRGKDNLIADILSRNGLGEKEIEKELVVCVNQLREETGLFTLERIRESQQAQEMQGLMEKVVEREQYKGCKLVDGILIKMVGEQEVYVVDREYFAEMARFIHLKYGHVGIRNVWRLLEWC